MDAWEEFQRSIPPPSDGGESVDWGQLSESWGKKFPADYRKFIETYGPGTIKGVLAVLEPKGKGPYSGLDGGISDETVNAEGIWQEDRKSSDLGGTHPDLIAWAVDDGGGILCWDATDEDPDAWPVLAYSRSFVIWRKYDCGMVEFLLRVLRGELEENPLSVGEPWGAGTATFLTLREELRMYDEDPLYAGIPYEHPTSE